MVPLGSGGTRKRLRVKAARAAYSNAKWSRWWRQQMAYDPWDISGVEVRGPMRRVSPSWGWETVGRAALRGLARLLRLERDESGVEGL